MLFRHTDRRGYSVMELVITMGVIGAALATAMIYQGKAASQNRVNNFATALQDTVSKVRAAYISDPNGFSSVTGTTIGNMKLYSPPIKFDGTSLYTPFTTDAVTVAGNATQFWWQFTVNQDECVAVGTRIGQFAYSSSVSNGGWQVFQDSTNGSWNMTNLINGCKAGSPVTLLFYFGKY